MISHLNTPDPAISAMTMDILGRILACADNAKKLGDYLSEEIRELTGARCVLLVRGNEDPDKFGRAILTIHPERRREWAESPEVLSFLKHHVSDTTPQIWNSDNEMLRSEILEKEGLNLSFSIPLRTGESHVGALFALGLPDIIHLDSVISLFHTLSPIVALVMRNASLFEHQEMIIEERTAEVYAAYEEIRSELENRKKIEEDLRSTNAYLENLISYSHAPIIIWNPSFKIIRINHAGEHLIGRLADEVIGKNVEILFPTSQMERSRRLLQTTREGVRWEKARIDIQHTNGSIKNVIWNSATLYSPDGREPVAIIAQGNDITDELRLEQEKDDAIAQIQKNIAQLSILNDEIRNPLAIIMAVTEMYMDATQSDRIIQQIRRIDDIVQHLDQRWLLSVKVLSAIRKHYHLNISESDAPIPDDIPEHIPGENGGTGEGSDDILVEEMKANLFTTLDSIDSLVIVTDIQSHDLLFLNRQGREVFGHVTNLEGFDSVLGNPLESNQMSSAEHCTLHTGTDSLHQWEYLNPISNRWYDCRDQVITWSDNRPVRVQVATDITELKSNEKKLQENEEQLRQITETIPVLYYVYDRTDHRFIYASPAYETIWQRSREELYHNPDSFFEAVHPDDFPLIREAIRNERERDENRDLEYRIMQPGGMIRWIRSRNYPVYDEQGRVHRIAGFAEDITARKQAEVSLRESTDRYYTLVQSIPDNIIIHRDGIILFVNQSAATRFGYTPEELIGSDIMKYLTPESQDRVAQRIPIRGSGDTISPYEATVITKDGSQRIIEVNGVMIRYDDDLASLNVFTDITETKQMIQDLREKDALFSEFISHSPIYTYIKSVTPTESRVLYASDNFGELIGISGREIVGKRMDELFPEEFAASMTMDDWNVVKKGEILKLTEYFNDRTYISIKFPVVQRQRTILGGYTIDITDLKNTEESLHAAISKIRLLTGITRHDIFNHLTVIRGLLDLAAEQEDLTEIRKKISLSREICDRINNTIAFTREYEDFGNVSGSWLRVVSLIQGAESEFRSDNIPVQITIPDDLEIYADPGIRKVFTTLLDNAIRHGDTITGIRFSYREHENTLHILCEDDGIGIPDAEKEHIFMQGYGKNTGIGLFMAREILSITGLSMREYGVRGEGAVFEILVPSGKWRRIQKDLTDT